MVMVGWATQNTFFFGNFQIIHTEKKKKKVYLSGEYNK